jgi:hypothetical protein
MTGVALEPPQFLTNPEPTEPDPADYALAAWSSFYVQLR